MPFGQLLLSIASVQTAMGYPLKNDSNLLNSFINDTQSMESLNKAANSLEIFATSRLHTIAHNETNFWNKEITAKHFNGTGENFRRDHESDAISIKWYLASFGALIMFFILISLSEIFCKKLFSVPSPEQVEVLPPPYELFAPPAYDSLYTNEKEPSRVKKIEIFVIHIFENKGSLRK